MKIADDERLDLPDFTRVSDALLETGNKYRQIHSDLELEMLKLERSESVSSEVTQQIASAVTLAQSLMATSVDFCSQVIQTGKQAAEMIAEIEDIELKLNQMVSELESR